VFTPLLSSACVPDRTSILDLGHATVSCGAKDGTPSWGVAPDAGDSAQISSSCT
jgi:hypothetical protein